MEKMTIAEIRKWVPNVLDNAHLSQSITRYEIVKLKKKFESLTDAAECLQFAFDLGYLGNATIYEKAKEALKELGHVQKNEQKIEQELLIEKSGENIQ